MKRNTLILSAILPLALAGSALAKGPDKPKAVEDKAASSRGGGVDENAKGKPTFTNATKGEEKPAPPEKNKEKSRSGAYACDVKVENFTPWIVQVYRNGDFSGVVDGYGTSNGEFTKGTTTLYGKADFDDGSTRTWGPRVFDCTSFGNYTWTLTR